MDGDCRAILSHQGIARCGFRCISERGGVAAQRHGLRMEFDSQFRSFEFVC